MTKASTDLDNPWKDVIDLYFEDFMQFFFPKIHKLIDWNQQCEFLDKELQKVVRDAAMKKRLADKLVKVWLKEGDSVVLYIHIEIQAQKDDDFAKRMFIYNYRLFDRYGTNVISLAILGDDQSDWRPKRYRYGLGECETSCAFSIVKLLDYNKKWKSLEKSKNPFSIVVRTHLKALETRRSKQKRLYWKKQLFKALYEANYSEQDILELFRFLDWVMALPENLEKQFNDFSTQYEEDKGMPYVTSIERFGIEKGLDKGREEGILQQARKSVVDALRTRFKRVPQSLVKMLQSIEDAKLLSNLHQKAILADSLKTFKQGLEKM
ncbi:MAG: cytosolic protein [Candidatus Parabeggiatoa sp. nov. 3]|nr:MAG: cytosolic protein [Gammaproteobacteria bacterium]RKZ65750.1 MAG: cytosolic protein [Gammaproteobacteria bacterium]RKZ89563.1 MAG: cytosolic protein [Gammaproteobacteria bacterium]HEW97185.1 cytosolic protein [Beggiatoa sp.]